MPWPARAPPGGPNYTGRMNRRELLTGLAAACVFPALAGADQAGEPKALSTDELEKLLEKRDNLFFLDVRDPDEIRRLGSVEGYVNIPLDQLEKRLGEVPKNKAIVTL